MNKAFYSNLIFPKIITNNKNYAVFINIEK